MMHSKALAAELEVQIERELRWAVSVEYDSETGIYLFGLDDELIQIHAHHVSMAPVQAFNLMVDSVVEKALEAQFRLPSGRRF